jgi:hypothetical protein
MQQSLGVARDTAASLWSRLGRSGLTTSRRRRRIGPHTHLKFQGLALPHDAGSRPPNCRGDPQSRPNPTQRTKKNTEPEDAE